MGARTIKLKNTSTPLFTINEIKKTNYHCSTIKGEKFTLPYNLELFRKNELIKFVQPKMPRTAREQKSLNIRAKLPDNTLEIKKEMLSSFAAKRNWNYWKMIKISPDVPIAIDDAEMERLNNEIAGKKNRTIFWQYYPSENFNINRTIYKIGCWATLSDDDFKDWLNHITATYYYNNYRVLLNRLTKTLNSQSEINERIKANEEKFLFLLSLCKDKYKDILLNGNPFNTFTEKVFLFLLKNIPQNMASQFNVIEKIEAPYFEEKEKKIINAYLEKQVYSPETYINKDIDYDRYFNSNIRGIRKVVINDYSLVEFQKKPCFIPNSIIEEV